MTYSENDVALLRSLTVANSGDRGTTTNIERIVI